MSVDFLYTLADWLNLSRLLRLFPQPHHQRRYRDNNNNVTYAHHLFAFAQAMQIDTKRERIPFDFVYLIKKATWASTAYYRVPTDENISPSHSGVRQQCSHTFKWIVIGFSRNNCALHTHTRTQFPFRVVQRSVNMWRIDCDRRNVRSSSLSASHMQQSTRRNISTFRMGRRGDGELKCFSKNVAQAQCCRCVWVGRWASFPNNLEVHLLHFDHLNNFSEHENYSECVVSVWVVLCAAVGSPLCFVIHILIIILHTNAFERWTTTTTTWKRKAETLSRWLDKSKPPPSPPSTATVNSSLFQMIKIFFFLSPIPSVVETRVKKKKGFPKQSKPHAIIFPYIRPQYFCVCRVSTTQASLSSTPTTFGSDWSRSRRRYSTTRNLVPSPISICLFLLSLKWTLNGVTQHHDLACNGSRSVRRTRQLSSSSSNYQQQKQNRINK